MKLSDFIADYLIENNIKQCFSVTGGFAMHLNDSFGSKLNVMYTNGEGPAGYSAIGYSKISHEPSVVCVTAGCGETNAVTPCMIAYQDSVPIFFISGGVPHKESIRWKRLKEDTVVRTFSGSDHDVIETVKGITKYACVLWNPCDIKEYLDRCIFNLTSGIPGPVWMSIPLDLQSSPIDFPIMKAPIRKYSLLTRPDFPIEKWNQSKRPVILVGNGVYLSRTKALLEKFVDFHKIPVVSTFFATDISPNYNMGRVGILGDRTGNFVIQNADFILNIGSRLSKSVIGYRQEWFAREAEIVSINIEKVAIGETLLMDIKDFLKVDLPKKDNSDWFAKTQSWKTKWFRELPNPDSDRCPYTFLNKFYNKKPDGGICVSSSGSIFCVNWHQFLNKGNDEFIISSHGDMGFELPCSIGCAVNSTKPVYCIVGDGSFQFNFQELQTIKLNNLNVKILYFNNGGYGAIQITQDSYFKRRFGVDIVCPDVKKVCHVYDLKYFSQDEIDEMLEFDGPCLIEIVCDVQMRHPKLSNIMRADGTFDNRPFEDMHPFLDRDEFYREMCIKQIET